MKNRIALLVACGSVAAFALGLRALSMDDSRATTASTDYADDGAAPAGDGSARASNSTREPASASRREQASAQSRAAPGAGAHAAWAKLSEDETALLAMYDEMAVVMERHADDCAAIAAGVRTAVSEHETELRRVIDAASQRGAGEAREAEARIDAVAGGQTARFRALVSAMLQTCATEIMTELQRLSTLGGKDKG